MPETRSGIDRDHGHRLRSRDRRPCGTGGFVISIVDIVEGGGGQIDEPLSSNNHALHRRRGISRNFLSCVGF